VPARIGGLDDVVIGESAISRVGGATGELAYRGYPIGDVVGHLGFEGTLHLLWWGRPPDRDPPAGLVTALAERRPLAPEVARWVEALPPGLAPMDALRSALSALGGGGAFAYPPTEEQGFDLVAKSATLLAALGRRRAGLEPCPPRRELGHAANFLAMLLGRPPDPLRSWALESYFDIVADHGMNASTFALRVVLSTRSDLLSAATAAVGALKGPLHGGAPEHVLDMLDRVGEPSAAERWVRDALDRKERLMGFGHRAYKVEDPRAVLLRGIAERVADPRRLALARAVETAALAELGRRKPELRLFTNVEFYAAVVLEAAGLPRELFPPTFAIARTVGWVAHALEQTAENRLIRPEVTYVGPVDRRFDSGYALRTPPA
jgi:citrate synthase